MSASLKIYVIMIAGVLLALFAAKSFCAEELKFQYITSLYADNQELKLKQPEGVACSKNNLLIVADTGNARLVRYTFKDSLAEPAAQEIRVPQLRYPRRVKMNSKSEIFVLDGKLRRIIRITANGKFNGYIDPQSASAPSAYAPISFHIDNDDNLYILDIFSGQVIVLGTRGETRKHIKLPGEYGFFTDLTVDSRDRVLLLDSVNARVYSTTANSTRFTAITEGLKAYMRFPADLTTDRQGRIYLVDRNGSKIIILARDGSFLGRLSARGWKEGLLRHPSQMCINDRGQIFVADTNNSRVQVFVEIESQ
jgi:sugar lactone lactonase YvrE